MANSTTTEIGAYLIRLLVGSGAPGAPTLHITGVVNAPTGAISAHGEITQAINAPPIEIPALNGRVETFGADKIAHLHGKFVYSVPPPAIGSFLAEIDVLLKVDTGWNGTGSFSYLTHHIRNVPVKSERSDHAGKN